MADHGDRRGRGQRSCTDRLNGRRLTCADDDVFREKQMAPSSPILSPPAFVVNNTQSRPRIIRAMATLKIGQRVELIEKRLLGRVAFIGETEFATGKWIGVVLDEGKGKNNGVVKGKEYFSCPDNFGIFVRQAQLRILLDDGSTLPSLMSSSGIRPPSVASSTTSLHSPASAEPPSGPATTTVTPSLPSPQIRIPSVRQMSQSMIHSSPASQSDVSGHELKIRDLEEKLETLLLKRAEDKAKLKEHEKLKIQFEQLQEFKKQMQNVQAELQSQLAIAKKEAKEAIDEKERHVEETRDLEEAAEMATLDKEMAEEKLEQVSRELELAKEKAEELALELEIIKEEIATKGSDGASATYEVKQLESKNEKLTEALLKLRDISNEDKAEIHKLTKELEKSKQEATDYQKAKERLSSDIQSLENQIIDLKEQVDSALGAQEMVERLTEKNLALEDEIDKFADERDVLEKLVETNEQLLESAKDTERELIEERDMIHSKFREALLEKDQVDSVIVDYKNTIERFREERDKLNNEIALLKSQKHESAYEAQRVVAQEVEHNQENIEFKIRFHEKKVKDLEAELKKSEERNAKQQEEMSHVSDIVKELNVTIEELKSRMEAKESEVHQLKKALKQKIEEASEAQIRKEMAEKKLQSSCKDLDDRSGKLQKEVDDLKSYIKKKEKEYEDTMTHLQSDIEDLEKERDKLRLKLSSGSKGAPVLDLSLTNTSLTSLSSPTTRHFKPHFSASTPLHSGGKENESIFLSQIDVLRKALSTVSKEKRALLIEKSMRDLHLDSGSCHRELQSKPLWLLRMQHRENEIDPRREKLQSLMIRVEQLQQQSRSLLMQECVLQSDMNKKRDHLLAKQEIVAKYAAIRIEVREFVDNSNWKRVQTSLTSFRATGDDHTRPAGDSVVARLRLASQSCGQTIKLNVTSGQLLRLHSSLL